MAGSFADVPAQRIAYDIDGTSVLRIIASSGSSIAYTLSEKQLINNEISSTNAVTYTVPSYTVFVFPTSMKIYGYLFDAAGVINDYNWSLAASYSTNTTNGSDGTWTSLPTPTRVSSASPGYRNNITVLGTPVDVKAIRFYTSHTYFSNDYSYYISGIHLYGNPNIPLELEFWHPTLDQALSGSYFDFGDVGQNTNSTKVFRLKNFSTQAAKNVKVSIDVLTETSPTVVSQHLLSLDNTNWYSYVDLVETGGIAIDSVTNAPNNISPLIYFKRTTSPTSQLGLYSGRIVANVGIWI